MKLAIHCANLTWPGGPAALGPTLAEVAQRRRRGRRDDADDDGPLLPDGARSAARPSRCSRATPRSASSPARPSDVELGLLVTGVTYRHPGLLAKIVTTLDVLSGGRAMLGIGAAWYEREHAGLGVPFPSDLASASSGSRRRCRSAARCGATTTARSRASTTSSPRPSARPPPIQRRRPADPDRRQRRAQDAAAGRAVRRRLQPLRLRARRDARTRSRCSTATAPTWAATRREVQRTALAGGDPLEDTDGVPAPDGGVRRPRHRPGLGDAARRRPGRLRRAGSATRCSPGSRARLTDRARFVAMTDADLLRPRPRVGGRGPRPGDQGRARGADRERRHRRARRPLRRHPRVRHRRPARRARRRPQPDEPRRRAARGGRPGGVPPGRTARGPRGRLRRDRVRRPPQLRRLRPRHRRGDDRRRAEGATCSPGRCPRRCSPSRSATSAASPG